MIECLVNYYTNGNKAKFASMIGAKPQTISAWIARNTFDAEQIYAHCEDISADWLLSGKGDMIKVKQQTADNLINESDKGLIELCKLLVANYQQRDDVMNKLVSMVKGL